MIDTRLQLRETQEKYQRRQIRAMIKSIKPEDRQRVLERISAEILLNGSQPCKNALETALKGLREPEPKKPVGRPRKETTGVENNV